MRRTSPVLGWFLALVFGIPASIVACLWDRDTPEEEGVGLPEVVNVLTGRFERNPPLFYEMRLARVSALLQSHPEDLAAYDDAGVACDRLGRGDEAIAWMEKKRTRLEPLDAAQPEAKEQRYRYHANLGTFLVHRWVRQGADRAKIDEVKSARDHIAKALEINPNAHFGRETYQLRAIEWIIDPPKVAGLDALPNLLGWDASPYRNADAPQKTGKAVGPKEADDAVRGLAGLIVLGNAWESVDVYYALSVALQYDTLGFTAGIGAGRNYLAYFAWLRCRELIDAGKGSMLPDAPRGDTLKPLLLKPGYVDDEKYLAPMFAKLRSEADAWHAKRIAFMTGRLKEGRHPDTNPDFWAGYTSGPEPSLPTKSAIDVLVQRARLSYEIAELSILVIPILVLAFGVILWRRSRRKPVAVKDGRAEL